MISKILLRGCLLAGWVGLASAQENYFDSWPAGVSPKEVGKNLAEHFVTSPHQYTMVVRKQECFPREISCHSEN